MEQRSNWEGADACATVASCHRGPFPYSGQHVASTVYREKGCPTHLQVQQILIACAGLGDCLVSIKQREIGGISLVQSGCDLNAVV